MMEQKRILRVVVASPGDVQAERDALPAICDEINRGIAAERNLLLELHRWETDAYPGLHPEGAQGLIDPILKIENCDIFIGIFWKRFGTPTADAQSGTEHEIRLAFKAWQGNSRPQVMLYFNREEYYPKSLEEIEQIRRVMEFEQGFQKQALCASYKGLAEFKDSVRKHLTNLILNTYRSLPAEKPTTTNEALESLIKTYRDHLAQQVGTVRIFDDADLQPLEKVFVELNITEEYERPTVSTELLSLMDIALRRQRDPYAVEDEGHDGKDRESTGKGKRSLKPDELLQQHAKAVITGAPGCGKTTLIKYLVLQTLSEGKRFPVHLELKSINRQLFTEVKEDLAELLFEKVLAGLLQLKTIAGRDVFRSFFFDQLNKGEVAIFLDGLDEVHGEEFFPSLCKSVNAFMRSVYRYNALIITTRPYALVTRFEGLAEMEIAPLNQQQTHAFLNHYYGDLPLVKQLSQHLRRHRELSELARVPFLLGVIAELYRQQGDLVGVRLQLYRQIVKRLVVKLDKEKSVDRFIVKDSTGAYKLDLLKRLAYERLFVDSVDKDIERLVFTDDDILQKARQNFRPELQPEHLVADVIATPLLREVGANTYAFSHLTIQEYLAAEALSEQEDYESIFCRKMFNPTVVAMEVLPKAVGLIRASDSLYQALEQLPESLLFTNLRLRARGISYLEKIGEQHLNPLINQVYRYVIKPHTQNTSHLQVIISSFAAASNHLLESLVERVIPLLRHPDAAVRSRAAYVLGETGATRAVDELLVAMYAEEEEVYAAAAMALSKIGDERTIEGLLALLNSCRLIVPPADPPPGESSTEQEQEPPSAQAELLGTGGVKNPTPLNLKQLLAHESPNNIGSKSSLDAAADALQRIGHVRVVDGLLAMLKDERWFLRQMVAAMLGRIGDARAVAGLTAVLKDDHSSVQNAAILALGQIGDPGSVENLVEIMQTGHPVLRERAVESLGKIRDARAVKPLLMALKIRDTNLRLKIANALGEIGDKRAVDWLLALLKVGGDDKASDNPTAARQTTAEVYGEVTQALANIGGARAVDILLELLKHQNLQRRKVAADALGQIGDARAVEHLLVLLKDSFVEPRTAAAEALGKIGDRRAIDGLLAAVQDAAGGVRLVAAKVLKKIVNTRAVEGLAAILRHDDFKIRWLAAETLGDIGDAHAATALMSALNDNEPVVRGAAASALGKLNDRRAVEALLGLLIDPNLNVRPEAAHALGRIGDARAVAPLLGALQAGEAKLRQAAIEALGNIGDARAVDGLVAALGHDDFGDRCKAAQALGKINDERAVSALLEALRDDGSYQRQIIIGALARTRDTQTVGGLLLALKDKTVRQLAMVALRRLSDEVLAQGLERALAHPDDFVRKMAAQGVGYYSTGHHVLEKLSRLAEHDAVEDVRQTARAARNRYAYKLRYFA